MNTPACPPLGGRRAGRPERWPVAQQLERAADQPQPPTFRLFDRQWGPEPGACDFAWVSDSLRGHVRGWAVDSDTRLSDHQPVLLQLD